MAPSNAGGWTICGLVSIPQVLWGEAAEPTLLGRADSHALRAFSSSSPFRRWWGWRRQNRRCKGWGQKEDNGESRTRKTWERDEELKGKAAVYRKVQEVGALWMFIADISVFFCGVYKRRYVIYQNSCLFHNHHHSFLISNFSCQEVLEDLQI